MHLSRFRLLFHPIVLLILLVAGCQPQAENQPLIGVLLSPEDLTSPLVQAGFQEAATRAEVRLVVDSANGQLDRETRLINKLISSGARALVITPASPALSYDTLARARQAGIPVICFRTCVEPSDFVSAYVTVDDRELGGVSGDAALRLIVGRLDGEARVGILGCGQDESCRLRKAGFLARVRMLQSEITAEAEISSPDSAQDTVVAMLNAHPEINLLWAADRVGTAAAVNTVRRLGRAGQVFVFGSGIDDETVAMLQAEDDILQGLADYLPYQMGFVALDLALNIEDQETSSVITIPPLYLGREDSALIQEFQRNGGRLILTSVPRATSVPGDISGACSTCNPRAHPVIPTP